MFLTEGLGVDLEGWESSIERKAEFPTLASVGVWSGLSLNSGWAAALFACSAFKFEIANQGARTPKFKTENYVVE